jgi:cytosine/adenosine deaminase-related metal-dependent hydrolase
VTTTLIRGGTVVAFHEGAHHLLRDGQVLCEDGQIAFVGREYAGPADRSLDASDRLVIPGLVDVHCHAGTQAGERMIADVGIRLYAGASNPVKTLGLFLDIGEQGGWVLDEAGESPDDWPVGAR